MNSDAAQPRENGTEIVRLFARFALGASFLSAVADRFGLGGHMEQRTYPGEISLISWDYTGTFQRGFASDKQNHVDDY